MGSWEGIARRFFTLKNRSNDAYELLSTESSLPVSRRGSPNGRHTAGPRRHSRTLALRAAGFALLHLITLRRFVMFVLSIPVLLILGVLWSGIPPSYDSIREFERHLPQHNLSLPFPEGEHGIYLRFPGHIWGHGLNNVLQEVILMSHLAYLSNRSYVFEDYTWSHTPLPYTIYDFALRPARIPLNAFISGPSAGGAMLPPRAISSEYWEIACPASKRVMVNSRDAPSQLEGDELLSWWVDTLKNIPARCVEVDNDPPVFDWFLFGSKRVLSTWSSLSQSPIIRDYAWSPLVTAGVTRNFALLKDHVPPTSDSSSIGSRSSTINGLVAVHLRRGDYVRHCPRLASWGATYMGFNQFPSLPDRFEPPEFSELTSLDGRNQYYLQHCWPEISDIVKKLHEVRKENTELKRVYILTNGWGWWVNNLKDALLADGWGDVRGSLDVQLDKEQLYVSMAVDMAIAERAEIFIGNGFSSLSSNIVMLRMAKQMNPRSNRFW